MENQFSQIASLIGDPVRSKILWALLDGRAYTATELAVYTDTSAPNISMHLTKLVNAGLLSVEHQGRHRYYNYSRPDVPYAIEAIANLLPKEAAGSTKKVNDKPIRFCRTCYDHLAGKVGVLLAEALINHHFIAYEGENFFVTEAGDTWFNSLGISVDDLKKQKRAFARPCLDWSERKHHLAGSLGAALLNSMIADGWVRKEKGSRTMIVTSKGQQAFYEQFRIDINK
jgi:DNA-binding transcriptional ArsR family regulator